MTFSCVFFNFLAENALGQWPSWTISCAMLDDLGLLDQWIMPLGISIPFTYFPTFCLFWHFTK